MKKESYYFTENTKFYSDTVIYADNACATNMGELLLSNSFLVKSKMVGFLIVPDDFKDNKYYKMGEKLFTIIFLGIQYKIRAEKNLIIVKKYISDLKFVEYNTPLFIYQTYNSIKD